MRLAELTNNCQLDKIHNCFLFVPQIMIRYIKESCDPSVKSVMSSEIFLKSISSHCQLLANESVADEQCNKPGYSSIFSCNDSDQKLRELEEIKTVKPFKNLNLQAMSEDKQGNLLALFLYLINIISPFKTALQKNALDFIQV